MYTGRVNNARKVCRKDDAKKEIAYASYGRFDGTNVFVNSRFSDWVFRPRRVCVVPINAFRRPVRTETVQTLSRAVPVSRRRSVARSGPAGRASTGPAAAAAAAGRRPTVTTGRPRAAACRSAATATPATRTGRRPERARPTCSTAWRRCTRRREARTPAPCRCTGSSSRAPWARASGPGTAISRNLWTAKRRFSTNRHRRRRVEHEGSTRIG